MPTRAEILDTLAASQTQVLAFFHGLSPQDLERPATASDAARSRAVARQGSFGAPGAKRAQRPEIAAPCPAGEPPDVILRLQYPEGMPLPGILGDLDALTPEEEERLELAVASVNQTYRERAP